MNEQLKVEIKILDSGWLYAFFAVITCKKAQNKDIKMFMILASFPVGKHSHGHFTECLPAYVPPAAK